MGGELTDSRDIAESVDKYLNRIEHMVSVLTATSSLTTECKPVGVTVPQFALTAIDESVVTDLLKVVDIHKATGCDNIQTNTLKLAAVHLFLLLI